MCVRLCRCEVARRARVGERAVEFDVWEELPLSYVLYPSGVPLSPNPRIFIFIGHRRSTNLIELIQ